MNPTLDLDVALLDLGGALQRAGKNRGTFHFRLIGDRTVLITADGYGAIFDLPEPAPEDFDLDAYVQKSLQARKSDAVH
jgi:hypothetical protein